MEAVPLLVYLLSLLVSIEGQIRKYPPGEKLIQQLAANAIRLLEWRANADVRHELRGITSFLGWVAAGLIFTLILSRMLLPRVPTENVGLAAMSIAGLWTSFNIFVEPRKHVGFVLAITVSAVVWPWLLPPLFGYQPTLGMFGEVRNLLDYLGLPSSETAIAVSLTVFSLIAVGGLIGGTVFIPATTFFMLWLSGKTSSRLLSRKPIWVYYAALMYFVVATMYYLAKSEGLFTPEAKPPSEVTDLKAVQATSAMAVPVPYMPVIDGHYTLCDKTGTGASTHWLNFLYDVDAHAGKIVFFDVTVDVDCLVGKSPTFDDPMGREAGNQTVGYLFRSQLLFDKSKPDYLLDGPRDSRRLTNIIPDNGTYISVRGDIDGRNAHSRLHVNAEGLEDWIYGPFLIKRDAEDASMTFDLFPAALDSAQGAVASRIAAERSGARSVK